MDEALNWLWQGCAVAAVAAGVLRLLPRTRAAARHAVWAVALLSVLGLPFVSLVAGTLPPIASLASPTAAPLVVHEDWWTMGFVMVVLWCGWMGACAIRLARAAYALRLTRQSAQPFPHEIERSLTYWNKVRGQGRRARLVIAQNVGAAAAIGGRHPLIAVAPELLEHLGPDELDRIVLHEWMHLQRRDDLTHAAQLLAESIAGWHPGTWWIARHLRMEREIASDEAVVELTGSAKAYASCLLRVAELPRARQAMAAAPSALMAFGLRRRVERILSHGRSRPVRSRARVSAASAVVCASAFAVCGISLVEVRALMPEVEAIITTAHLDAGLGSWGNLGDAVGPLAVESATLTPTEPQLEERLPAAAVAPGAALATGEPIVTLEAAATPAPMAMQTATIQSRTVADLPLLAPVANRSPAAAIEAASRPWSAAVSTGGTAADAATSIGRQSQKAAVKTAGFFSQFGQSVAGAFQP
jgi:beta-lactamase regulating signal transducer with metallopeptidase domain